MNEIKRVAVVVFCEVTADGQEDAEIVATSAVRNAMQNQGGSWPAPIDLIAYGRAWPVVAVRCLEAGIAAGNGYLWTRPTSKGFLEGRR